VTRLAVVVVGSERRGKGEIERGVARLTVSVDNSETSNALVVSCYGNFASNKLFMLGIFMSQRVQIHTSGDFIAFSG